MSFQEMTLIGSFIMVLFSILWKWTKTLMMIILFESMTSLILAITIVNQVSFYLLILFLFIFFVSEALILLSSLYSSLRTSGLMNSSLII